MKSRVLEWSALAALSLLPAAASANPYLVSTDRFSYTGSVTVSGTQLHDGTYAIPTYVSGGTTYTGRDAGVFMASDAPTALSTPGYENANLFLTAWWYSTNQTQDPYSGWDNPNNTNTGFVQLYDIDGTTRSATSGTWNSSYTQFTLSATGSDASYTDDYARLWPAPVLGGAGNLSRGTFLSYNFQLVADFANPASLNAGWRESTEHPVNISGSFTGTFLNQSSGDPTLNGIYTFNLSFQNQNWAVDQGGALNGAFSPSYFGAAVPEPQSFALLLTGLVLLGFSGRRRKA